MAVAAPAGGKLTEELAIAEAEIVSEDRREVEVTVLEAGLSKMGWYYSPDVLAASVPLFDRARAFADHPGPNDRPERSIRDVVGYYHSPRFVPAGRERGPGQGPQSQRPAHIRATLKVLENAGWLWSVIREAVTAGHTDLIGLSVDYLGRVRDAQVDGRDVRQVESIQRLFSVDVVTRPSAGGRFERILMSDTGEFGATSHGGDEALGEGPRVAPGNPSEGRQTGHEGGDCELSGTDAGRSAGSSKKDEEATAIQRKGERVVANAQLSAGQTEEAASEADGVTPDPGLAQARAEAARLIAELQQQRRVLEAERTLDRELADAGLPPSERPLTMNAECWPSWPAPG